MEEEVAGRASMQKQIREVEGQKQEITEDLESEREARNKADKQRRDLAEV